MSRILKLVLAAHRPRIVKVQISCASYGGINTTEIRPLPDQQIFHEATLHKKLVKK